MKRSLSAPLAGFVLAAALVAASQAGTAPFVIPHGTSDYTNAVAGRYTLDPNHVGVLARVSHLGFSISIFRFETVAATLDWDPKAPAKSKLSATVQTASITSNVPGFAADLAGVKYLNAGKFPQATFVTTAFHRIDATHGRIDGSFTLKGKTRPMTFAVVLIGAGPGFAGSPQMGHVIGIHAEGSINPQDFDMDPLFDTPIQIVIDTEFDHKG